MIKYILILVMLVTSIIIVGCGDPPKDVPKDRWYTQAQVGYTKLTGAKATIVTKIPSIVSVLEDSSETFSIVYCCIANKDDKRWAQMGYGAMRPEKFMLTFPSFYSEVQGDEGVQQYWSALYPNGYPHGDDPPYPPGEGDIYDYKFELDTYNGEWLFYLDNNLVDDNIGGDTYWSNNNEGNIVTWTSETTNSNHDMAGYYANPCKFTSLFVQRYNQYESTQYKNNTFKICYSDSPSEWGIEWDTSFTYVNEVRIWDINPQP